MKLNLLEGFGSWINKNMNIGLSDFADMGNTMLTNIKLTPDGSDKEVTYSRPTMFSVKSNADGTIFKLCDISSKSDNVKRPENPHSPISDAPGATYTLDKDAYEKLLLFPKTQQPMGL